MDNSFKGRKRPKARLGRRLGQAGRFIPNAIDGDNDGLVQDDTPFERPATPRRRGNTSAPLENRFLNPRGSSNNEIDFDEFLRDIQRNQRNRQKPVRPDDPDKPGEIARDLARGTGRARPSETADEKPKTIVADGVTKQQWDALQSDLMDYFMSREGTIEERKKRRALFKLMAAIRMVNVSSEDGKLRLEAKPSVFERISRGLRGVEKDSDGIRNLVEIRNFLVANKASDYELVEVKALGRKLRGSVGNVVRRFVRGARFDPDARDADNDGIVQEGTQFARRSRSAARKTPAGRTGGFPDLKGITIKSGISKGVAKRDAARVRKTVKRVNDAVEKKYGKIVTRADAVKALDAAHPNITKYPDFLENVSDSTTLNNIQRAQVAGWLFSIDSNPVLRDVALSFRAGDGDSCSFKPRFDGSGNRKGPTGLIAVTYNPSAVFSKSAQNQTGRYIDSVSMQAGISILQEGRSQNIENPDRIREVVAEAETARATLTALHELSGHGVNFVRAYNDRFGGLSPDQEKAALKAIIKEQGDRLAESPFIDGGVQILQMDQKDAFAITINQLEELDKMIKQTADSVPEAERSAEYGKILKDDRLQQILKRLTGRDKDFLSRSDVTNAIDDLKKRKSVVEDLLAQPKYADLRSAKYNFKRLHDLTKDSEKRKLLMEFYKDYLTGSEGKNGVAKAQNAIKKNRFYSALMLSVARNMLDDLTPEERKDFMDWMESVSKYGSKFQFSYYHNNYLNMPVESVAELLGALMLGVEFKNKNQENSVRKLMTWLYGDVFEDLLPALPDAEDAT